MSKNPAEPTNIDPAKPHAFLSYTRFDDRYLNGGISALHAALEDAVRARTGRSFRIFQDVDDIRPGDDWKMKLDQAIEAAQLFIPILTPNFFGSDFCRREARSFLDYEARAKRNDLVLPIYLIDCQQLDDEGLREADDIARHLHRRQYADWRDLRFNLQDHETRPRIFELAGAIAEAISDPDMSAPPPIETTGRLEERLSALEAALQDERRRNAELQASLPKPKQGPEGRAKKEGTSEGQVARTSQRIERGSQSLPASTGFRVLPILGLGAVCLLGGGVGGFYLSEVGSEEQFGLALFSGTAELAEDIAEDPPQEDISGGAVVAAMAETEALAVEPAAWPMEPGETFRDCSDCPEMVVIPAGQFLMGSLASEEGRSDNEKPVHLVDIKEPFALGKYEVRFAEWKRCVFARGCTHVPDHRGWGQGDRPVINVSWEDAQQYCGWLSEKTGSTYRLPSEAEWEYAARAGEPTAYFWGDAVGKNRANCDGCGSQWDDKKTAPVGSFKRNAFGLFDMHGNVSEWVEDSWHDTYNDAPSDSSAWLSDDPNADRVVRGGSWFSGARSVRSAYRFRYEPGFRHFNLGFRCAGVQEPL